MKISFFSQEFGLAGPWPTSLLSLEEVISKGAEIGFDGVELETMTPRISPLSDRAYVKKVKELCESKGLVITDIGSHPDFLHPGNRAVEKELYALKGDMELAVALDVKLVRVQIVSTMTYSAFPQMPGTLAGTYSLTEQYLRGVDCLRKAVDLAEDMGVTLGFDNHYFLTVLEQLKIVREINSPNLKMFIDAGNCVLHGEDLIESARACGKLLVHSHVKDPKFMGKEAVASFSGVAAGGTFAIFVPLGEGVIDWEAYLRVLKEIGYKGFLSLETHTRKPYPDWEAAETGLKYLRNLSKKVGI